MTATLYTDRPLDRVTPRPVRANYGVRRAVAALVVAAAIAFLAVAVTAMAGVLADVGGRPAAASDVVSATPVVRVHVAQPGDTLWSIADRYRGEVGHGRFVDALIDLNGGTAIQAGQAVRLP